MRFTKKIILTKEKDSYVAKIIFAEDIFKRTVCILQDAEEVHPQINDLIFQSISNSLIIKMGWKGLKDLNPYSVLYKIIEKVELQCALSENEFFLSPLISPKIQHSLFSLTCQIRLFGQDSPSGFFSMKVSNMLYFNIYDEVRRNLKEESNLSQFRICLFKIIEGEISSREFEYMLTQPFCWSDFQISWLESLCLIPYLLIGQYNSDNYLGGIRDKITDCYYYSKCLKIIPQTHSISLAFLPFLMPSPFENSQQSLQYLKQVINNPNIVWKSLPISVIIEQTECQTCIELNKTFQEKIAPLTQKITDRATLKEIRLKQGQVFFSNQHVIQKQHIKTVNIKITLFQSLMQAEFNFKENQPAYEHIEQFKSKLDEIFNYYFQLIDEQYFPSKQSSTSYLKQGYWSFTYTSIEKLEVIIKSIKSFVGQLQKFLRFSYYFSLLPKDLQNQEQISLQNSSFVLGNKDTNQQIFCQLKDPQQSTFSLVLKYQQQKKMPLPPCAGQQIKQQQSQEDDYLMITNSIYPEGKLNEVQLQMKKDFYFSLLKSTNYSHFEKLSLSDQKRHLNNYYLLIQNSFDNNPNTSKAWVEITNKFLSFEYIGVDFSQKGKEGLNKEANSKIMILFDLHIYYDTSKEVVNFKIQVFQEIRSKKIIVQADKEIPPEKQELANYIKNQIIKNLSEQLPK